ncbi:MAG: LexA family transcriptional regulator [Sediminibacterium sp.]|nr:LexA family transcriptional regulator [Sediminibacterium sp.]
MSKKIPKNLKYIRNNIVGVSQEKFAKSLGISRAILGAYEEGRAKPNLQVVKKICSKYDLSFEQFLFKDITQVIKENEAQLETPKNNNSFKQNLQQLKLSKDKNSIIFVPIKAAAGYLEGYSDEKFLEELNSFTLPMLGSGNFRAFEIKGDSMLPTPSGSIIIGQKIEKTTELKMFNTYIILTKEHGVVYKRIQEITKNQITLQSDNQNYKPFKVEVRSILEIWKAQYIIQKPALKEQVSSTKKLASLFN